MKYALSFTAFLLAALPTTAAPPPEAQDVVFLADARPYLIRFNIYVENGRPFVGPHTSYLRRWFAYLDRNGDGILDRDEVSHAPTAQQLLSQARGGFFGRGVPAGMAPKFQELDTDGDGKVTVAEFSAYYRRAGFGPLVLSNGNQFGNSTAAVSEAVFRALDTDGDGRLSKAELARAATVLSKFDQNDDEMVSAQELTGNAGFVGQRGQALVIGQPGPTSSGPLLLVPQDEHGRLETAKSILAHYDKNHDGTLSRDEMRLPADLFARLNKQHDGKLTATELADWLSMPAERKLAVSLGAAAPDRAAKKVDDKTSGDLNLTLGDLRVQVKQTSTTTFNINSGIRQFFLQNFKAADKGNKGFLTAEDVKERQMALLAQIFTTADHDGDGKLTEKELTDYLDLIGAAPQCQTNMTITEQGNGLFEMLDANGDGQLSVRELRNAAQRLAKLERGGYITRSDLPRQLSITLNSGPPSFGLSNRGQTTGGRLGVGRNPARSASARGPLWFRKMDLNGDGDVSPREFLGTPEEFKRIDEDGDGLISAEEAERYESRHAKGVRKE